MRLFDRVLNKKLAEEAAASVPDGSIVTVKLANGSVTEDKIAEFSVTTEKIADASVTTEKIEPNAVTSEKLSTGAVTNDKLAAEVHGRFSAYNLLDNSDFRNPVNQRGATSYAVNDYTIDRWRLWNAAHTVTIGTEGITVAGGNLVQYILASVFKAGVTYTFAAKDSNGNLYVGTGSTDTPIELSPISGFAYTESRDSYSFSLGPGHTWVWAALYEGEYTADTLPEYTPKGYGAELSECQRYYLHSEPNKWSIAYITKANYFIFTIPTPVSMRIDPSIISSNSFKIYNTSWYNVAVESFTIRKQAGYVVVVGHVDNLSGSFTEGMSYLIDNLPHLSADL